MITPFTITQNTLHVWCIPCPTAEAMQPVKARTLLSPEECIRMEGMRSREDAVRFCVGRSMLRHLSGRYLSTGNVILNLATGDSGKPYWQDFRDALHFNISHSGAWVLLAFSARHEVGIDVQQLDKNPRIDLMKLARNSFHAEEISALEALPDPARKKLFNALWSSKEAVIKATGKSVLGQLDKFSAYPLPSPGNFNSAGVALPYFTTLNLDEMHSGAVAIQCNGQDVQLHEWSFADSGFAA